ncbi:flagellar export chaperone FlgN [Thiovibrio frasassiensis]|uniref:Flagellar protein FlgN n=1 Tax=Thiovibrio frasassiensis TaxID=2984131 RepID=A0A9X4RQ26_9BACT|nr:flagellar export chaperone FlgN [Thiovibrio frasassiensis]MDG4475837.1 flagellar protein FlgN [Thiovibrio frasassiensis]
MQQTTEQHALPAKFFEALEQEILLSQDLLVILNEEQKALVIMDMQALILLSNKKENRLSRLQALDSLLADLTRELCPEAKGKTARLGALIPLLSQEEGETLNLYRTKLSGLREEILSRTQINKHFAADVKTYLNDAISLITSGIAERPMYGLTGRSKKPSLNQPSFISREV